MSLFESCDEARDVGIPLLRLHRAAIGRDPDEAGFLTLMAGWRQGMRLEELAARLLGTAEARGRHGDGRAADAEFVGRVAAQASGRAGTDPGWGEALAGFSRAQALAALATIAQPGEAPILPALFADCAPDDPLAYQFWRRTCERALPAPAPSTLLVSLVIAVGDASVEDAARTLPSLRAQSHAAWDLTIVARLHSPWARDAIEALVEPRVRVAADAVEAARGEAVCLLDPGDMLASDALAWVAASFSAHPDWMLLYTDEDRIDAQGRRSAPRFKPGFSMDAMVAGDMMGKLVAYRAALFHALGGPDPAAAPFEAYDLALRGARAAGAGAVGHVPRILFHHAGPVAERPPPTATRRAMPADPPLVTVVMATRDRADLLRTAARGVLHGTDYPAIELLIVDNDTTEPDACAALRDLATDPRVRVLPWPGRFNFAAMNNRAARLARGAVLLLLNNDIEIVEPPWLGEMATHAMRPDVGAVGARLLDRDGRLQHGGIVLGPDGQATHVLRGAAPDDPGYLGQLACARDLSAVTGACLAIRREVWDRVDGMDEALPVAWNDIDLCQRVRAAGLRVIWTPHASLIHLEGATRGRDAADPAQLAAFEADRARYRATWGRAADVDPFLNPNLMALGGRLCLTEPRADG